MPRLLKVVLAILVVLLVAGGAAWWLLFRDDSPPPPELAACEGGGDVTGDADTTAVDGAWTVAAGEGYYVGYRIGEQFGGDTFTRDAVARSSQVEGSMAIDDGSLTEATVTVDLTALESEDPTASRRDTYLQGNGLEIEQFPEATFELSTPAALAVPPEGACVTVEVAGDLTLHGVTAPVTLSLDATWTGDAIEVAGTAPVVLADFDIVPPDVAGLATAEEEGAFELLLRFEPTSV
jgi:polyisoprenoid-binding protein YceI